MEKQQPATRTLERPSESGTEAWARTAGERAVELRYMGFQQKQNRRLYRFDMNDAGTKSSIPHVVSVDMELFLKHHVGIQEGPALCAQKITPTWRRIVRVTTN